MKTLFYSFIFLLFSSQILFADQLKDDLIRIHATLIPKMIMMDYDFENRLVDDSISIAILYDNAQQRNDALALKRHLKAKYPNGFQNHPIVVEFISYKNITKREKHTLYYFLPSSQEDIQKSVKIIHDDKALSFAYRNEDLKYGVMLSVKISNKVKPVVNVDALKAAHITMRPVLLKVAEIYFQISLIKVPTDDKYSLYIV